MIFSHKIIIIRIAGGNNKKRRENYSRGSRELSIGGVKSGEILAQRPHVELGGPKGKISELL
jgi:hypothetical protein